MKTLVKGKERVEFKPCCCGTVAEITHIDAVGEKSRQRVSIHLARIYYRKWKDQGYKEDECYAET